MRDFYVPFSAMENDPEKARGIAENHRKLAEYYAEMAEELEAVAKPKAPPQPKSDHRMYSVSLQYKLRGPWYKFLILEIPGRGFYTTSMSPNANQFGTWEELWAWIESPDVHLHTALIELEASTVCKPVVWGAKHAYL